MTINLEEPCLREHLKGESNKFLVKDFVFLFLAGSGSGAGLPPRGLEGERIHRYRLSL